MRIEAVQQRPRRRLISLTPLIDVVFILLVFFMLASSFSQWRTVDLTVAGGGGEPGDARMEQVRLGADGPMWDGEVRGTDELVAALQRLRPEAIRVRVADGVVLQQALDLMVALRGVEGAAVSLAEEPED